MTGFWGQDVTGPLRLLLSADSATAAMAAAETVRDRAFPRGGFTQAAVPVTQALVDAFPTASDAVREGIAFALTDVYLPDLEGELPPEEVSLQSACAREAERIEEPWFDWLRSHPSPDIDHATFLYQGALRRDDDGLCERLIVCLSSLPVGDRPDDPWTAAECLRDVIERRGDPAEYWRGGVFPRPRPGATP